MFTENYSPVLSAHEQLVLKSIYNLLGIYEKGVPTPELITYLGDKYGKHYARTTVVTFLCRMETKGFVHTYRNGRVSYAMPTMTEKEYVEEYLKDQCDFLFDGNVAKMMAALLSKDTPKEQIDKIRKMLDAIEKE